MSLALTPVNGGKDSSRGLPLLLGRRMLACWCWKTCSCDGYRTRRPCGDCRYLGGNVKLIGKRLAMIRHDGMLKIDAANRRPYLIKINGRPARQINETVLLNLHDKIEIGKPNESPWVVLYVTRSVSGEKKRRRNQMTPTKLVSSRMESLPNIRKSKLLVRPSWISVSEKKPWISVSEKKRGRKCRQALFSDSEDEQGDRIEESSDRSHIPNGHYNSTTDQNHRMDDTKTKPSQRKLARYEDEQCTQEVEESNPIHSDKCESPLQQTLDLKNLQEPVSMLSEESSSFHASLPSRGSHNPGTMLSLPQCPTIESDSTSVSTKSCHHGTKHLSDQRYSDKCSALVDRHDGPPKIANQITTHEWERMTQSRNTLRKTLANLIVHQRTLAKGSTWLPAIIRTAAVKGR